MVTDWTWTSTLEVPEIGPRDEERLLGAAIAGEPDAFEELVRLHQQRVFRLAGRFFTSRADVEDAAQDTFLQAWRKLDTYRGEAPFEHWLTRVCLRCCYARLRKSRPEVGLPDGFDIPQDAGNPAAGIDVERLLARLSPDDRFVLLLLDGEGWSTREIADRLGWTQVNVKVRAHRARKRLKKLLEATP